MLDTGSRSLFVLTRADRGRLLERLQLAVRRARRSGSQTLATASLSLPAGVAYLGVGVQAATRVRAAG